MRYTFFIILCLSLLGAKAQTALQQEFLKNYIALNSEFSDAYNAKDWAKAESSLNELITLYDTHKDSLPPDHVQVKYNALYNLACVQSLQGKLDDAEASLVLAIGDDTGRQYESREHVVQDTDLDNIRDRARVQELIAQLPSHDYLATLKAAPGYVNEDTSTRPKWEYQAPSDSNLVRVRQYFRLDSVVAGCGTEVDSIKALMVYIHDTFRHDGSIANPDGPRNAINYGEACKNGAHTLNCRGLATVLNECYLAMGFHSRLITCYPKVFVNDCHVINTVWSRSLDKWLWMDPTNAAWVTDDQGNLLSIAEVRDRLRNDLPVMINEDANWNHQSQQSTQHYLYNYMAKNLYELQAWSRSCFGTEGELNRGAHYILLIPDGETRDGKADTTYDDAYFWARPE